MSDEEKFISREEQIEQLISERDALKAEAESTNHFYEILLADRDTWRSLAEGLADKLKEAIHKDSRHEMKDFGKTITYCQTRERVEEALAAFDAAKRGTK